MTIKFYKRTLTSFFLFIVLLVLSALIILPPMIDRNMNLVTDHLPFKVPKDVKEFHKTLIIGDWHADSTLWNRNLIREYDYGHVDIPRLQRGNVAIQMFTTVTKSPAGQNYNRNETDARDNITALAIVQRWPIKTWTSLLKEPCISLIKSMSLHCLILIILC